MRKRRSKSRARQIVVGGVISGFLGWAIENSYAAPRYSWVMGGQEKRIPWLPIYALGGVLLFATAPELRGYPMPLRFIIYAIGFSALEYGACKSERAMGCESWDYEGSCVDLPHAIAWGAIGVVVASMIDK